MAGVTAIALGTLAVASTAGSYFEQKKAGRRAEREQRKANQASRAAAQVDAARQRRRAIAQARIAQARNQASMSASVGQSSSLAGAQSSVATQLGSNIGAQLGRMNSQRQIQNFQQNVTDITRRGQERAGLWQLGGQVAQFGFNQTMANSNWGGRTQSLDTSGAGSVREGYTGGQFQTWLNNQ